MVAQAVAQEPHCPPAATAALAGTGDGLHGVVALMTEEETLPLSSEDGHLGSSPVRESQEVVISPQHVVLRAHSLDVLELSPASSHVTSTMDTTTEPVNETANTLAFVNDLATPITPPLCTPSATTAPKSTKGDPTLRSSQLVGKPTAGLATVDKVKLVLLKKHVIEEDETNPKDDLKKYNNIYKQQLPPDYIKAVASLVDAAKPERKGGAPAMQAVMAAT
ncbi:hypothetical protein ACQ4PT_050335 [Festuca glaucescens]